MTKCQAGVHRCWSLRHHSENSHGIADDCDQFTRIRILWRERQRLQRKWWQLIHAHDREISIGRDRGGGKIHGCGRSRKICDQLLEPGGCAFREKRIGVGVSVPGLSYVAIGGDESIGDYESGAGDSRALERLLVGKPDFINAEDVADGIAIAVQDE